MSGRSSLCRGTPTTPAAGDGSVGSPPGPAGCVAHAPLEFSWLTPCWKAGACSRTSNSSRRRAAGWPSPRPALVQRAGAKTGAQTQARLEQPPAEREPERAGRRGRTGPAPALGGAGRRTGLGAARAHRQRWGAADPGPGPRPLAPCRTDAGLLPRQRALAWAGRGAARSGPSGDPSVGQAPTPAAAARQHGQTAGGTVPPAPARRRSGSRDPTRTKLAGQPRPPHALPAAGPARPHWQRGRGIRLSQPAMPVQETRSVLDRNRTEEPVRSARSPAQPTLD